MPGCHVLKMVLFSRVQATSEKLSEQRDKAVTPLRDSKHIKARAETDRDPVFHGTETKDVSSQCWLTDPQNPMNWSPLRKWMIMWLLVITNIIAYAHFRLPPALRPP